MIARFFLAWLRRRPLPPVGTQAAHPLPDVAARPIPPVPGPWWDA